MEFELNKADTIPIESVHLNQENTEYKFQPFMVMSFDSNTKSDD